MRMILLLLMVSCTCLPQIDKVKITSINGTVEFTDEYNPDASVCIPAAYTDTEGEIEGLYCINGVTYGKQSLKERVSLDPDKGLTIGREWKSGNGFQQHVLVKDGEVRHFRDRRRFKRRALCNDDSEPGRLLIIESTGRMTMNEFAAEVAKYSKNAVNLDMGRWGYGWIGEKVHSPWAVFFKHWQTNWIVCQ
jgi:hypothetical protein